MLRHVFRAGLRPPAVWVLLAGLVIILALFFIQSLEPYRSAWPVPFLITLVAWLGMSLTGMESRVDRIVEDDPLMQKALERRDALAREIGLLSADNFRNQVEDVLKQVDKDILPEFERRLARFRMLEQSLNQYQRGRGPLVGASQSTVSNLKKLGEAQKEALEGLLTKLSDMVANLIGLSHSTEDPETLRRARNLAGDMATYWEASAEVFKDDNAGR